MTSDHIKITAKLRSVSKAAEKLSISQPALSVHIKKIEEENGIIIFDRTRKPLTLTEQGRVYLKYSEKKDELEKELKKEISDLNGLKTGNLVIGGASAFNSIYLPRAVKLFTEKYPGIKTVIIDDRVPEIERRTLEGEIDLFLTPPRISHREIMSEILFDDRILLCVPPEWEINEQIGSYRILGEEIAEGTSSFEKEIDFSFFKENSFVLLGHDQHLRHVAEKLFHKYAFRPKRYISTEQTTTSFALTIEGAGISFMTESAVRYGNFKKHPAYYFTEKDICSRKTYVAYAANRGLSRAGEEFIKILKECLAALQ